MEKIDYAHQVTWAVTSNPILSLLTTTEQKQLGAKSSLFSFAKHEALYRAGDAADCAWAVVTGQVKIVKENHAGHALIIELFLPNETCGGDCYTDDEQFIFSAFAMEETTALRYPLALVRKFADANLRFSQALAKDMCRRLYHAQHMRSLSIEDVAGRVACALVYLQDKFGDEIPHTRATLAALSGTTVESAIRATKSLSRKGILATSRNRIRITSVRKLKEFAHKTGHR